MPASNRRSHPGFTVAECLVAVMVFAVGVLGLAGTVLAVQRLNEDGATRARAVALAWARMETLRAGGCSSAAAGAAGDRGIAEKWSVGTAAGVALVRDSLLIPAPGGRPPIAIALESAFPC